MLKVKAKVVIPNNVQRYRYTIEKDTVSNLIALIDNYNELSH